jgi:hypothetical protein
LSRQRAKHGLEPGAQGSESRHLFDHARLQQMAGHVQHQQRLHAIERKSFPSFGEGDKGQAPRMTEELGGGSRRCDATGLGDGVQRHLE